MSLSREKVYELLDELEAQIENAESDPEETGKQLRQQIIDDANNLASATGDYGFPGPSSESGKEAVQEHLDEINEVKRRAVEVRKRAMLLPISDS